jgi:hypothetical protein
MDNEKCIGSHPGESAHQTVTGFIELQTPEPSIQIGFTDQKVSGRAGLLTFAGFLHRHRFSELLGRVLPHQRRGLGIGRLDQLGLLRLDRGVRTE